MITPSLTSLSSDPCFSAGGGANNASWNVGEKFLRYYNGLWSSKGHSTWRDKQYTCSIKISWSEWLGQKCLQMLFRGTIMKKIVEKHCFTQILACWEISGDNPGPTSALFILSLLMISSISTDLNTIFIWMTPKFLSWISVPLELMVFQQQNFLSIFFS